MASDTSQAPDSRKRCQWATSDALYQRYHDEEWGRACFDDHYLFELLCLEGMQAGLSWLTVLKKRDAFRLFCNQFDPAKLVLYNEKTIDALMQRSELIRNRAKLKALVENARACLVVSDRHGSFSDYVWQFVDAKVVHHHFEKASQIPSVTSVSLRMAKQMQQDGFRFVGGKVCYAFMQASGMVNDHTQDCFCYAQICSS